MGTRTSPAITGRGKRGVRCCTHIPTREFTSETKSGRSQEEGQAEMGMGATNTLERVAASLGLLEGITPAFQTALDIPRAGLLFALPALLASGLLKYFSLPRGYYRLDSLLILMAFRALARIKTVAALRYESPGEWGNLLGLDRVPEAKTLRQKIALLSEQQPAKWMAALCRDWREGAPDIDGPVRVYHGHQTKLPKHHVARHHGLLG